MRPMQNTTGLPSSTCAFVLAALCACGGEEATTLTAPGGARYALASVVIDADGDRTLFVQTLDSLDEGPFDNGSAIELPGNGVVMAHGRSFYVGLTEEPTWVRYSVNDAGAIEEFGRLSLLGTGAASIDYGNVIVDDQTAVTVLGGAAVAVVWDPSTMELKGEIPLPHLTREGYEPEVWTTSTRGGLVYIPGRWSDWEGARIYPAVSTTIIDPSALSIVGIAEDDRCGSGGRVVFDAAGYGYVMGDGRNYSQQMFAHASGAPVPGNCLLRIAPGETDFEEGYFHTVQSLTGGLESIGELETARQGSGVGFAKLFYPDQLPAGVEPVDFDFWDQRAHKLWRIELGDAPTARAVEGIPFSTIGFEGSELGGHLYSGESPDGSTSDVYETDPDTNTARLRFTMDGYFNGLYELTR